MDETIKDMIQRLAHDNHKVKFVYFVDYNECIAKKQQ